MVEDYFINFLYQGCFYRKGTGLNHHLNEPESLLTSLNCAGQGLSVPGGKALSKDGKVGWEKGLRANLGFRQREPLPQDVRQSQPGLLERAASVFQVCEHQYMKLLMTPN